MSVRILLRTTRVRVILESSCFTVVVWIGIVLYNFILLAVHELSTLEMDVVNKLVALEAVV